MNSLHYIRFHGPNRPQTVDALTAPDVVVTTYATVAADLGITTARVSYINCNGTELCLMKVSITVPCFSNIFAYPRNSSSRTQFRFEAMESSLKPLDYTKVVSFRHTDSEQNGRPFIPCGLSPTSTFVFQGLV